MRRRAIRRFILVLSWLPAAAPCAPAQTRETPAGAEATAAEVVQAAFGDRLREGGIWRQDNGDFEEGSDAAKYWIQIWRDGPGGEVVTLDAYAANANESCTALLHAVFTHDPETGQIRSYGFGAGGLTARGVVEHQGTVTTIETTVRLPGGTEVRLRDREDQASTDARVVRSERWDGQAWTPSRMVTWRRSAARPPCSADSESRSEP